MDKIVITLGLVFMTMSLVLISKLKAKFSDKALIEYARNIKPAFLKYYFIGSIPLLILTYSLLSNYFEILHYIWFIISAMVLWDIVTLSKLNHLIKRSDFPKDLALMKLYLGMVLLGKALLLIGLKLYLDSALQL